MNFWVIYNSQRYEKNFVFAKMLMKKIFDKGHLAELKILDNDLSAKNWVEEFKNHGELPNIAIMRCDNFELSTALEKSNVRVVNSAFISKICNDKWITYNKIEALNIDIPPRTNIINSSQFNSDFLNSVTYPKILKSPYGHGGNEVFLVNNKSELKDNIQKMKLGIGIMQDIVGDSAKDVRVYVIGNKIITSILRTSDNDFRSNFSLGGKASPYFLNENEINVINKILSTFDFDFVGIDFLFDDGKFIFNEIEDVVGCRMVYAVTDIDIVDVFIKYLISDLNVLNS